MAVIDFYIGAGTGVDGGVDNFIDLPIFCCLGQGFLIEDVSLHPRDVVS